MGTEIWVGLSSNSSLLSICFKQKIIEEKEKVTGVNDRRSTLPKKYSTKESADNRGGRKQQWKTGRGKKWKKKYRKNSKRNYRYLLTNLYKLYVKKMYLLYSNLLS